MKGLWLVILSVALLAFGGALFNQAVNAGGDDFVGTSRVTEIDEILGER